MAGYLLVGLHDDRHALAGDLGQDLQRVHGLLPDGGVGGSDLSHQVMGHHVEGFILGGQQLLRLLLVLQRRGAPNQQLLQSGLRHGDRSIRHLGTNQ